MHYFTCLLGLYLVVMTTVNGYVHTTCSRDFYKLGCYRDKHYPRGLSQLLFTDRDPFSPKFQQNVDWKNWDAYIHSLACRCENLARSRNYTMFGLQYYGECWAGTGSCDTFARFGRSQICYGQKYNNCDNDDANECVGGPHANYVYLITE